MSVSAKMLVEGTSTIAVVVMTDYTKMLVEGTSTIAVVVMTDYIDMSGRLPML